MQDKFKKLEDSLCKDIERTGGFVIKKDGFTTYRNILKGYLGDFATEYWTQEDWDKHDKYVEELKTDGTYGEPWICELILKDDPIFDKPNILKKSTNKILKEIYPIR